MESGIDHVDLRVADLARSAAFYEAALAPLGWRRRPGERIDPAGAPEVLFAREDLEGSSFGLHGIAPGAPGQDVVTTGAHVAFAASGPEAVAAFHAAAVAAGGRDIGAPGPRPEYRDGYHGAFVLDPDGNNIEAVCHTGP